MGRHRTYTDAQVTEIRRQWKLGRENKLSAIARRFNVPVTSIHTIVNRQYKTAHPEDKA